MNQISLATVGAALLLISTTGQAQLAKTPSPDHMDAPGVFMVASDTEAPVPDRSRVLVIPQRAEQPKDLAQMEEDLSVMTRILEKAAQGSDDPGKHAMGISIQSSIFGTGTMPRSLYLEGYGAVFFLNVPFPLAAPASKSSDEETTAETGSDWDEARRELYAGSRPVLSFDLSHLRFGPTQPYEAEKVEDLKNDLLSALKNAVHIRKLKREETVSVVILGGGVSSGSRSVTRFADKGRNTVQIYSKTGGNAQSSRLVIRAKRADIEAFQKGEIDLGKVREKVSMSVY